MTAGRRLLAAVAVVVAMTAGAAILFAQAGRGGPGKAKAKAPEPCERACLEDFVNQYLDGLVAHSVFSLPLASRVRFSENNQLLDLGDGLWNVTSGLGPYKIYISDIPGQQAGFIGTLLENDRPVTLALRLKIVDRKISEIETIVHRAAGGGQPPGAGKGPTKGKDKAKAAPPPLTGAAALNAMVPDVLYAQTAPEGQRATRDQLIAAANSYFDALERSDASLGQLDPQCERMENGVKTANTCAQQVSSRAMSHYQVIYPRRFPVVDEERQLVLGSFTYQQPGDLLRVEAPGGKGMLNLPESATQPAFVEVVQLFKMVSGKIRKMEALSVTVPYGTPDPFFNDDWRRKKQ